MVSRAFYVATSRKHPYHWHARQLSLDERLRKAVVGDATACYPSIGETLERFAGWLSCGALVLRYEEFQDAHQRRRTLARLYEYVGVEADELFLQKVSERVLSDASPTFRSGRSGDWARYLRGELYEAFLEVAGSWLETYGYRL